MADISGIDELGLRELTVTDGIIPASQDGAYLGTSSKQFSDLFLADGASVSFGDDNEITLTHIADTGLTLTDVTNNSSGPELRLSNNRGANNGLNNDLAGIITFFNNDSSQNLQSFGSIGVTALDATSDSEQGKIRIGVACTDNGGIDTVLTIVGGTNAAGSTTTVEGLLDVNNITFSGCITQGSDASGDMYYRNSSGVLTRIPVGSDNHVLTLDGSVPGWEEASGGSGGSVSGDTFAADLKIGRDSDNKIDFATTDNEISLHTSGVERMVILSSGNVGIGTDAPQGQLHISSGDSGDCALILQADTDNDNEDDNPRIEFWQDGSFRESGIYQGNNTLNFANNVSDGGIKFHTGNTSSNNYNDASFRMIISSNGGVGIGTDAPATLLHLKQTTAGTTLRIQDKTNTSANPKIELMRGTNDTFGGDNYTDWRIDNDTSGYLQFRSQSNSGTLNTQFTIQSNGSMGYSSNGSSMGATPVSNENSLKIRPTGISLDGFPLYTSRKLTNNLGHIGFYNPNGRVGQIRTSNSSTLYQTSSDYRLKENVIPMPNAINRLNQLKPYRFNFIPSPDKTVDGFLAHEVQTVVPEAISGVKDEVDEEGNPEYQGIDQSKLVPLLVGALQEQQTIITDLLARVTALENP